MSDKKLKAAPTTVLKGTRANYDFLSNPDPYEGEAEDDYQSRKNLFEAYNLELTRQGITVDDLVMAELGITKPSAGSTLLHGLIGRL